MNFLVYFPIIKTKQPVKLWILCKSFMEEMLEILGIQNVIT